VVDIRIYRAALIPALLALVVAMFSVQDRPAPLTSTLAPDAFDAKGTFGTLRQVTAHPDRTPGSVGDAQLADMAQGRLRSLPGFETSRDVFSSTYDGKDVKMANVVGVLNGPSERQIVVMASRDSIGRPGTASAADTAMLLELARASAGFDHSKTLVFVSTDGAVADNAGARRFAARYPERGKVDSVLVLDDLAATPARKPYVVPWSLDSRRSPLQLQRTVELALSRELGTGAGSERATGQFIRQAWPLTFRQQGPLIDNGLPAITLTAHGDSPREASSGDPAAIDRNGLLHLGKAALASVLALDAAPRPVGSPEGFVVLGRKVLPRWAISLLALALLAPVLAGAIDGFARAVRRGRRIGGWMRWTLAAGLPFLVTLTAAYLFELLGWLPKTASEALAPASGPTFAEAIPALIGLAIVFALSWLLVRPLVLGSSKTLGPPSGSEAALAVSLIMSLELLILWKGNPFAALLLIPSAHLALMCALPEQPKRAPFAATVVAAALLLPALALLYYATQLGFGLDVTRYGLLLLTGGGSPGAVILVSMIAGSLASAVLVGIADREPAPIRASEVSMRGPLTYAGPGSLGATDSALARPRGRAPRRLRGVRGRSSYRPIHGSGR